MLGNRAHDPSTGWVPRQGAKQHSGWRTSFFDEVEQAMERPEAVSQQIKKRSSDLLCSLSGYSAVLLVTQYASWMF